MSFLYIFINIKYVILFLRDFFKASYMKFKHELFQNMCYNIEDFSEYLF